MKELQDESKTTSQGDPKDAGTTKGVESSGGVQRVEADKGRVVRVPKIQGSSITLEGSGDRSGRDVNNSMSLGDFYGRFVVGGKP